MALLQVIYTSHAAVPLDSTSLREMVAGASRKNRAHGITGMLYCANESYLQVLEGDEKAVLLLYADILRDSRHDDIHTVVIRPIEQADFPNWSMGFLESVEEPIDLTDVLNRKDDRVGVWNDAKWQSILNTFRAELETIPP
jgi:hypothetical protein